MSRKSRQEFMEMDRAGQIGHLRSEFDLGQVLYFNGNSLGPLPNRAKARLRHVVDVEWGKDLIRSWNVNDWITLPRRVGDKIAPLIGAAPQEVIVGDSTSVGLFKLISGAVRMQGRKRIVTDADNFPTDLYVLSGLSKFEKDEIEIVRVPSSEIVNAIDSETALVTLTHIDYKSSRVYDMAAITAAAHQHGALALWDLSHSVGAVPVDLNRHEVDLAVGCTYKYLNGGPGSPGFCFVASRLQNDLKPALTGWMGHARPFDFSAEYVPADGIQRLACGTPEVLALSSIDASLELFANANMDFIRKQSIMLSETFITLLQQHCAEFNIEIASPLDSSERGGHVAIRHPESYAIMQALIARNIIGDFRAPDVMRFSISPLYNRCTEIWDAIESLAQILADEEWKQEQYQLRRAVT